MPLPFKNRIINNIILLLRLFRILFQKPKFLEIYEFHEHYSFVKSIYLLRPSRK